MCHMVSVHYIATFASSVMVGVQYIATSQKTWLKGTFHLNESLNIDNSAFKNKIEILDVIFKLLPLQNSPSWPKVGISASDGVNKAP